MVYLSSDGVCLLHKRETWKIQKREKYCGVTLISVDSSEVYSGPL